MGRWALFTGMLVWDSKQGQGRGTDCGCHIENCQAPLSPHDTHSCPLAALTFFLSQLSLFLSQV